MPYPFDTSSPKQDGQSTVNILYISGQTETYYVDRYEVDNHVINLEVGNQTIYIPLDLIYKMVVTWDIDE